MTNNRNIGITAAVVAALACLCCVCVASGAGFVYYSLPPTETATLRPTATLDIGLPSPPEPTRESSSSLTLHDPAPASAQESLSLLEDLLVPEYVPVALAEQLGGKQNVPRILAESAAPRFVGDTQNFFVSDMDTDQNNVVPATLRYVSEHLYFWVANDVTYSANALRALGDLFENTIYPTNREFFGSEWSPGIDGDIHLYVLYTKGMGSSVAGYFSSSDEFSTLVNPYSNGHEMFYLSADNVTLEEAFATNVLAHEFQHMIHWALDRNEDGWLNEGFSELAVLVNDFEPDAADFYYLMDTDMQLTNWPSSSSTDTTPWYGGSFLFTKYFLDRFGPEATQRLVRHKSNGMDSVNEVLREIGARDLHTDDPLTASMFFGEFAAAILLNDGSANDGRFAFHGFTPNRDPKSEKVSVCPTGPRSESVSQFGIDYFQLACSGDYTLAFSGETVQTTLPAALEDGSFYVWSNRGNESDMTLTRAFDLPAGGSVRLQYRIWYDIEEDWDYAYLSVSEDGGKTWNLIQTPSGTDSNPQGSNYGWGWTGTSGGGTKAKWLDEEADLSAFAGRQVLIRFQYITDAAVNGEGLILDDIRIPEAGYRESFEAGMGGWEAAGFFRLDNRLPQTFEVLVVRTGRSPSVERLTLDPRNYGEAPLRIGAGEKVYLIVIGTTPYTFQKADYQFELMG